MDLRAGKVVRLKRGDFDSQKTYSSDPLSVAKWHADNGAKYLHIVDMDGAKTGVTVQTELIKRILRDTSLVIQTGGGIRNACDVIELVEAGADKVILGSIAAKDPDETCKIFEAVGSGFITLGIDVRINMEGVPMVAVRGWQEDSQLSAADVLNRYTGMGLKSILCTDISRDGMLEGTSFELYQGLRNTFPELPFLASGGVAELEEIPKLRNMGMAGVIVGKALYEGRFTLQEALGC